MPLWGDGQARQPETTAACSFRRTGRWVKCLDNELSLCCAEPLFRGGDQPSHIVFAGFFLVLFGSSHRGDGGEVIAAE
jgi:hypothetical protein